MDVMKYIDSALLQPSPCDYRYENGPFKHLKAMPPRKKGSVFNKIVQSIVAGIGFNVQPRVNKEHDFCVDLRKIAVIGSTMNEKDLFGFLQIRPNDDFDSIYFSFFYADSVSIVAMDSKTTRSNVNASNFNSQHSGMRSGSKTYSFYGTEEDLINLGGVKIV